jgi:GxxExxY protein
LKIDEITCAVIGAAIEVHRELGPGLLESAYEACLVYELELRGLTVERQHPLPVHYKGVRLDCGYRIDLLVEHRVVVELKTVEHLAPVHQAQLLTYLRLAKLNVGLLLNFHEPTMRAGIRRLVHRLSED